MKNTGIVRRIDDLGRLVIPKEIRKSMFLKEGTPLEIHITTEGDILLKKHNVLTTINDIAQVFCEVIYGTLKFPTLITDCKNVICCEGISKKNYLNKNLSDSVKHMIMESQSYMASVLDKTTLYPIIENEEVRFFSQLIVPIIYDEICEGTIILLDFDKKDKFNNTDIKVTHTLCNIMSKILG